MKTKLDSMSQTAITSESKPINVICIVGAGRSGSTILDRVLGGMEGVSSFNEMHVILDHGYRDEELCSCRKLKADCPFWIDVFARLSALHDIKKMTEFSRRFDRSGFYLQLLTGWMKRQTRSDLDQYVAFLSDLYAILAQKTESDFIVDSSKIPTRPLLLKRSDSLRPSVIQLMRDPRAVVVSWARKKKQLTSSGVGEIHRYKPGWTLFVWGVRNIASELLRIRLPVMRVRYEDFAASPRATIERIRNFSPLLKDRELGFIDEHTVNLPALHTLSGNPDRFEHGSTEIRSDTKWKLDVNGQKLGAWRIVLWPIAARYGYYLHRKPS